MCTSAGCVMTELHRLSMTSQATVCAMKMVKRSCSHLRYSRKIYFRKSLCSTTYSSMNSKCWWTHAIRTSFECMTFSKTVRTFSSCKSICKARIFTMPWTALVLAKNRPHKSSDRRAKRSSSCMSKTSFIEISSRTIWSFSTIRMNQGNCRLNWQISA